MSLVKVIKGPVARAGSMCILLSSSGNAVPKTEANKMTMNRESVTVMGMAREFRSKNKVSTKMMEEQMVALIKAPPISFSIFWKPFFRLKELEARPCTTIAEDCIPTFPPMAVITGINMAVTGNRAISAS